MAHYVGLDVSLEEVSVCVIGENGEKVWEGKTSSKPEAICKVVKQHAPELVKAGFESGPLSTWHWHELKALNLPVVCMDARQANTALKMQVNKTDANDAHGLAQIVRTVWYREVKVKGIDAHLIRSLITARSNLVQICTKLSNQLRGILKTFGLIVGKEIRRFARGDDVCKRLMTAPGVGPVTALTFKAVIDDPSRFKNSSAVGAYLGLTPRRYQSGEVGRKGRISRCGDIQLRAYLFEASNVLLNHVRNWSALKAWGVKLARRTGGKKAKAAVPRKLAVILHRMWSDGVDFRWAEPKSV